MNITNYIESLVAKGRYTFPTEELNKLGFSSIAIRSALRRLRQKSEIINPIRGFNVILPPQYRAMRSMPPEYFIHELMQFLKLPYYVGLLSAAQINGAAHQQPQQFQVLTTKVRRKGIIKCGNAEILFIKRKNITQIPVRQMKTDYGYVYVSSAAVTAMDLVTYPHYCAGINHVVTVLSELAEIIIPEQFLELIKVNPEYTWIQRLGYLFDYLGQDQISDLFEKALKQHRIRPCALQVGSPSKKAFHDKKWNVLVNVDLEVDI